MVKMDACPYYNKSYWDKKESYWNIITSYRINSCCN